MFEDKARLDALFRAWCALPAGSPAPADDEVAALALRVLDEVVSGGEVADLLVAFERLTSWALAGQARLMKRLADERGPGLEAANEAGASAEVACALRLSPRTADRRLTLAWELTAKLPATLEHLAAGRITPAKAAVIADETVHLATDEHRAAVEQRALLRAADQTPGELRRSARRAALAVQPAVTEQREKAARNDRDVRFWPTQDGLAELRATLAVEDAARVHAHLDAAARSAAPDDARPIGVRRADALVDLVTGQRQSGATAIVQVTVSAEALDGRSDEPGEIVGVGPASAAAIRRLVAGSPGKIRFLLADPASGRLVGVSARTYRPSAALDRFIRLRDATCRFPGCRQPARRSDVDHGTPWPEGATEPGNLACLCRYHHRLKQRPDWKVEHHPDGTLTWTTPTGHRYRTSPDVLREPSADARAGPEASGRAA